MPLAAKIAFRLRSERGFAVPTVMMALVAAMGLATAGVVASVGAQSGTVRDQEAKRALAVAEAGIANALLRFNRIRTTSDADVCAPIGGSAAGTGGWCPTVVGPVAFDDGTFTYRVQIVPAAGTVPAHINVVSTGTVNEVSRRVTVRSDTVTEDFQPFSGEAGVIGLDSIHLDSNSIINAGVATNGNIGMDSNSALNCDYAQVGPGRGFNPANGSSTCALTEGAVSLPPVNLGDVATVNSNARLCSLDPCNKAIWSASTKRLSFTSGGSITLGSSGGVYDYALCQLTLNQNSYLLIARGADVRLWFLPPEDCANEHYPLVLEQNSKIEPYGGEVSGMTNLSVLISGSATQWTQATLMSNTDTFCSQGFILYAPRTAAHMDSNNEICGGVAAKSVDLDSNVVITATNAAQEWELPGAEDLAAHYGEPYEFVECSPVPSGTAPDSGC